MEKIDSAKNPLVKRIQSLKTREGRAAEGRIFVEGEKMVREALSAGLSMEQIFFTESLPKDLMDRNAEPYHVKEHVLKAMADTVTPQGIAATFSLPTWEFTPDLPHPLIALDGVQDPGNVGTIWRTADAAGYKGILLGVGSADAFSPKVQRATMGACFRVPAYSVDLPSALSILSEEGYRIIASALTGESVYEISHCPEKHVLIIGSEARGVQESIMGLADQLVTIPMRGGAESLNAAVSAGILMYLLTK